MVTEVPIVIGLTGKTLDFPICFHHVFLVKSVATIISPYVSPVLINYKNYKITIFHHFSTSFPRWSCAGSNHRGTRRGCHCSYRPLWRTRHPGDPGSNPRGNGCGSPSNDGLKRSWIWVNRGLIWHNDGFCFSQLWFFMSNSGILIPISWDMGWYGPYDYVNLHNKHIPHRFPNKSSANPGVQMIFVPINTFIL